MNAEEKNHIVKQILLSLESEKFRRWYEGDFVDYIENNENCKSEELIIEDVKNIFNLKD